MQIIISTCKLNFVEGPFKSRGVPVVCNCRVDLCVRVIFQARIRLLFLSPMEWSWESIL